MNERPDSTTTIATTGGHVSLGHGTGAHDGPHGHQVDLEVGLDFVNTLEFSRGGPQEHLPASESALRWFHDHGVMHGETLAEWLERLSDDPETDEQVIGKVRRVRGAMRELVEASVERRPPERDALERVNRMLRTPYTYHLVPAPDGVSLDHRHDGDPVDGALARLVESLAREVSQGHPERLRICADEECRWAFNDTSPTGRRKWCDMSTCGNRAKAARFRERRKQVEEGTAASA
jgi:predicted RNA-binding Zn ribbon-like protein